MTTIYLIRHGEVHNPNGILYGRLPRYGLSKTGRKEIAQTAQFLKNKHIDFIYSSPMLRARQTAEIIRAELNLPKIFTTNYLLEVRTSYQGKLFSDLSHDQSEVYKSPLSGDETLTEIAVRMQTFVTRMSVKHPGKRLVAVSHGDPLMILRSVLSGLPAVYISVRKSSGFSYIKHGEVVELTIDKNGKTNVQSIFIPSIS